MVSELYQLSRQLAIGTSMQKGRAWRQFFEEKVFWRQCRDAVRDPQALEHLEPIHQLWGASWDRRPIGELLEASDEEVNESVRFACVTIACAAVAALARDGNPETGLLKRWLIHAVDRTVGALPSHPIPTPAEHGEDLIRAWFQWLAVSCSDRRAVAVAQDTTLALFRGELRDGGHASPGRLRIPVLLSRGNEGFVAWLWLERVPHGFGEFLQAPDTRFDPLSAELRVAVDEAFGVSSRTVQLPRDEDVRWWLASLPGRRFGAAAPVVGASLQAAVLAGTISLLQDRDYDQACALSATVTEEGRLGPVAGIDGTEPKLRAALRLRSAAGFATVIVAPGSFPSETVRMEWEARGLRIRVAETIEETLPIVQQPSSGIGDTPPPESEGIEPPTAVRAAAILYAHGAEEQRALALALAAQFRRRRVDVFVDLNLGSSVEWAREADRRLRGADLVVPLISQAAGESEVFRHHLQAAMEAAEVRGGKLRIVPVVLESVREPLPEPLSGLLASGEGVEWPSAREPEPLAQLVLATFDRQPSGAPLPEPPPPPPAGVLPLDSRFYVVRPTDTTFTDAITRQDSIVRVKGARQMGKTSLLARGLQQAREAGALVVLTDCQMFNTVHLQDAETFLSTVTRWFIRHLKLNFRLEDVWDPLQGPNWNFREFLVYEVLARLDQPLVWALDEVDRLFPYSFGGEVFGMFRSWHNERALDPTTPLTRLTLAMAYATETHLFMSEPNQSPFNVGTRVTLEDFTLGETADLNERYGRPLRSSGEIEAYWRLLGGQPYLTHRGIHEMAARGLSLTAFQQDALSDQGLFGDHLRRLVLLLGENAELCEAVRRVLQGGAPSADSFFRLWSAGILAGDSVRHARPRCDLYATYLERHLP